MEVLGEGSSREEGVHENHGLTQTANSGKKPESTLCLGEVGRGCPWGGDFSVRSEVLQFGEVLAWSNITWHPVVSSCEILGQDIVIWDVGLGIHLSGSPDYKPVKAPRPAVPRPIANRTGCSHT